MDEGSLVGASLARDDNSFPAKLYSIGDKKKLDKLDIKDKNQTDKILADLKSATTR